MNTGHLVASMLDGWGKGSDFFCRRHQRSLATINAPPPCSYLFQMLLRAGPRSAVCPVTTELIRPLINSTSVRLQSLPGGISLLWLCWDALDRKFHVKTERGILIIPVSQSSPWKTLQSTIRLPIHSWALYSGNGIKGVTCMQ